MPVKNKFTVIDLFAGAGGFSLAAQKIGMRVLAAIENDSHAASTYRLNFIANKKKSPILFEDDINALSPARVLADVKEKFHTENVDIVIGGPPCQGFSKHRLKDSGVDDPRNSLLLRYFHYIHELQPKFFVVENVSGMLWPRHEKYIRQFYALAASNGYIVEKPIIIDAKNYGIPQNRRRVFIIGRRFNIDLSNTFQWPPLQTHFPPQSKSVVDDGLPAWVNASSVFAKDIPSDDPNAIHMQHTLELIDVFASTPKNGGSRFQSKRNLPCHTKNKGHNDVYGRICIDRPSPTMTTGCTNPSKGRFLHPTENHGISLRHAARFQTFPDDFIFTGGLISASRQIGNAIPILLGEKVLSCIKNELQHLQEEGV